MANLASKIDSETFDSVAAGLKRWSDKSLRIARGLLVDGKSLTEISKTEGVTTQHANVLRSRFAAKVQSQRVVEFMKAESPKRSSAVLEPFLNEMKTLRDKGYTITQVVAFLKKNGITTSPATVSEFLRSSGA